MAKIDAVTLEILWNRLISLVEEMSVTLTRASFSTVVSEMQDLSCGLFDRQGRMVAQSITGTPGHTISMATGVKSFLEKYLPHALEPGDTLITNDPWKVSGHLNDITIVTPVFHRGRYIGLLASTCHTVDIGGRVFSAECREVFEEGLQIPPLKLHLGGRPNRELMEIIEHNVRTPREVMGDLRAQVAANEVSAEKLTQIMEEFGLEDLEELSQIILSRSETAMREAISDVPDGQCRNRFNIDGFDEPLVVDCTVTVNGNQMAIDYTGSSPEVDMGINVVMNYTEAYSIYGVICALCPDIPTNEGSFRPIRVTAPEGCIFNAHRPAAVSGRHLTGHFTPNAVLGALAQVVPEKVIADSSFLMGAGVDGVDDGGGRFVFFSTWYGGMGARPNKDGPSTTGFPSNLSNTPVEIIENVSPLFILRKELVPDSGGPGKYRGGLSQAVTFKTRTKEPVTLSCMYEKVRFPPWGLQGGTRGMAGSVTVNENITPHPKRKYQLKPGEVVTVIQAGGGGFFSPLERDSELVLHDVKEGYVTAETAQEVYGVVINPADMSVDWEATCRRRRT